MRDFLNNILELGRQRLVVLGAIGVGMVLAVALGLSAITAPDRAILYQNLSFNSANAIQVALGSAGFDAQVSADGAQVTVPRPDVARARMVSVSGCDTLKVAVLAGPSTAIRVWKKFSVALYFSTYFIRAGT